MEDRALQTIAAPNATWSALWRLLEQELDWSDAEAAGEFEQGNDRWIALSALQAADILLAETGLGSRLFLCQTPCLTQASKVLAGQLAHIHARSSQLTPGKFINYSMYGGA
jgi:hypothetical protein